MLLHAWRPENSLIRRMPVLPASSSAISSMRFLGLDREPIKREKALSRSTVST